MFFNMTNGGAELAFKIVRYGSEEELMKSTPPNNTIGVVTSTPFPSWIFSAEEPESSEDNMLWIQTGNDSLLKFNALKKNSIIICPLSVKQYNNGTWEYITAKTYLNKWIDWTVDIILFDNGTTIEWIYKNATLTQDNDNNSYFQLKTANSYESVSSVTSELIQLNHQEVIEIVYQNCVAGGSGAEIRLSVIDESGNIAIDESGNNVTIAKNFSDYAQPRTFELNISNLIPGNYSIQIKITNWSSDSGASSCKIPSVKIYALKSS